MIFEDPSGRRRRWAFAALLLLSVAVAVPLLVFLIGRELRPEFPGAPAEAPRANPTAKPKGTLRSSYVFAANDDPPGARSIDANLARIDVIVVDWFRLPANACEIEETVDDAARRWALRKDAKVVARVANLKDDRWTKSDLLHDAEARACVAKKVAARAKALGARGINVDIESLAPTDADGLVAFVAALRGEIGDGLLSIDVTPDDPAYDLESLAPLVDAVIVMAYDEHEETSAPGPIASAGWFAGVVDRALAKVPREQLVVGVGSYCYDWGSTNEALTYGAAMDRAASHGSKPVFDGASGGTHFTYGRHEVWCGDALAVHNQLATLRARGLDRWALWRAGSEDPSLWTSTLEVVPATEGTNITGSGDGWRKTSAARPGERAITFAADGTIEHARYERVPTAQSFQRLGGGDKREVVLTFDDGPDPDATPKILDALRALRAEGTFFVLGEQAMRHPDLVRRIGHEGHLVGNHTFHHPHVDRISEAEFLRELRATERVLEGQLGRYTPIFRAPYTAAFDAAEPGLLAMHMPAFDAGYLVVGGDIDPADWGTPGAQVIAERIALGVEGGGRIVVLHDGGGDRTQTAEAVAIAVPKLRARGYDIVPLDKHLGLERSMFVAPVGRKDEAIASGAIAASFVAAHGPGLLGVLFLACTAIAFVRVAMLVVLAIKRRFRTRISDDGARPLVTILVPAYNEERVLRATVQTLLASDYEKLEIVIVDDGSTDDTYTEGEELAREDARVRCFWKLNGGKAEAANHGLSLARGEIVVCVDADTMIAPDAVRMLVRRFADPAVSAVCGNVEVGNVTSLLTAFQAIEYVTSQNIDRAALAEVNAVTVVPGALGAWRKSVLVAVGGYANDTLVEDADLTMNVLRNGGRIDYEPKAIARTEAPETLRALWKQRFRWTYGTYQCLAKHRSAFGKGAAGIIALPNLVLFQVIFPLLCPIGDAVMILALLGGDWRSLASGYLGFLAMDLLASVIAFRLENKPLHWLGLLLVQRFTYRPFMVLVCLRALLAAIAGRRHGWRKLERTGAVAVVGEPFESGSFAAARPADNGEIEPAPTSLAS